MSTRQLPTLMLTVDETAALLRFSKSYTKKLVARGEIKSVTIGRCRRVRMVDLEAYVADLSSDATTAGHAR